MEATRAADGLLDKIRPPRLEDAGLEDCALPPDSIKEAFLKATTAVRSSFFSDSDDETDINCVNDPWPSKGESADTLVGIIPEIRPPGACVVEKGGGVPKVLGDEVAAGLTDAEEIGDKVVVGPDLADGGDSCVDGFQGLNIGVKGNKGKHEEEVGERPILAEGYL